MIKRLFITFLFSIIYFTQSLAAVTDSNISGHVIDKEDGEHLAYFPIHVKGTSLGAMTDGSGHYVIRDLNPGKYTLEAAFSGYKTLTKTVEVKAGQTVEVNFEVEPDAFMLDQVVVTGSKSEIKRMESPALVNVLNAKVFSQVSACSLADGLNYQPGVRVENDCQNCGFTQVRINGLDGHYSQILMNSRPVFSALAGVYGLEQIPATMIDRVEVMRGGGSALFGSSAVGGTINIITKDPAVNTANVSHTLTSIGISGAMDNNTTVNASLVTDNSRAGLFIYGQNRNRDGYDHDGDGFTEIASLKSQTLGTRAFVRPNDGQKLTLEYHATHEFRRGGDNLDVPPHQAWIAEQVEHNINAGEATYDIFTRNGKDHWAIFAATQATKRQSYYGSGMDPDAYGRTADLVVTTGAQWTHKMDRFLFMPSELVAGVEYDYNRLHDVTIGYNHDLLQRVHIVGSYLQNEWRDEHWGFLVGARLDKHSMIDHPIISPRLNLRYNPSARLNLRASYSTGFRSPQAYDEDFHIAIVGGERVVTVLAPGLKQESSNSVSASADMYFDFGNVRTNFTVEGFYTDLRDVFALRMLDEPDAWGNTVLERYNGSGARVIGINLEAKANFTPRMILQAGATIQRSRYKEPEQWSDNPDVPAVKNMFRTPDVYGYLTYNWDISKRWVVTATGTLTGPMYVQHIAGSGTPIDVVKRTPTYFDANLKATYCLKIFKRVDVDIHAALTNVFNSYQNDFDRGPERDSGYIYGPMMPRSLNFGISISL